MSLQIGDVIERKYRISGLIGEGGMGAVFEGENIRIQRRVAIKVLHAAFTQNAEVVQRFEREAQAAGRIGNDHILEVLDLGTLPDGDLFLVMEFLDGEPLSARVKRAGRLRPEEVAPIMRQVLVGLRAAHSTGIVHRDLKPDNIFILREKAGRRDFVKIIDFGISKFQPLADGDGMKMTRTGTMMGTPYYMSPEQAAGTGEVDARSDIYALGVILYECVTGAVPFDAPSFNQLLFKIALSDPHPPEDIVPGIDRAFCSIVKKAMARQPGARFQNADELGQALDAWMATGAAVALPDTSAATLGGTMPMANSSPELQALLLRTPAPNRSGIAAPARSGISAAPTQQAEPEKRKPSSLVLAGAAAAVLAVVGAAIFAAKAWGTDSQASPEPSSATASATPAAAAPARQADLAISPAEPAASQLAAPVAAPEPSGEQSKPAARAARRPGATAAKPATTVSVQPPAPAAPAPEPAKPQPKPPAPPKEPAKPTQPDFGY
jgi:serine/threonine-protein kinase